MNLSINEAIQKRCSIRKFKEQPVPVELLEQIIEAARLAPSGTNRQPWRFALLTEPTDKDKIASAVVQPFVMEAPAIFICCLDRAAFTRELVEKRMTELVEAGVISQEAAGYIYGRKLPQQLEEVELPASAYLDLGIAVQNMVIQATALGLGSCWVRLFNPKQVHDTLNLLPQIEVVALLPVGYPAENPQPRPRLNRDDIMLKN